ncbi:unnamed protein product [Cylindrotheca closterium]|uniref:S1 motif domain-containing protein n=1 Tax=Cylindrotheca closterium TaxID=2856 RepID=A0AAD2JIX0_9STRA|nr:unnamed protein product [Cylindrotheca closterium]
MGGEGAKERRRLKRAGQDGGGASAADKKTPPFKRNDARMKPVAKHQFQKKPFGKGAKVVGKFNNSNNNNNNNSNHNNRNSAKHGAATFKKFQQTKSKKKNPSKKPKHLKRKLEQLGEDNAEEREAVLKRLNEWERAKENFSVQNKNKKAHSSKEEETKDTPSKKNKDVAEEIKAFPRGGSGETIVSEKKETSAPEPEPELDDSSEKSASGSASGSSEKSMSETQETPAPDDDSSEKSASGTETPASKPSNDTMNDSGSDDEPGEPRRQRGRRRRGRKDTDKVVAEITSAVEEAKSTPSKSGNATGDEGNGETNPTEKKEGKASSRYCTGRKPVTDFAVGKCYTGKVVYVKPFGVFIDIGCHSDAFCHVSRLSDDYVESPEIMFKEGDELVPRIVEIDRKQKKITVSLQSEARIADEHKSMVARKERKVSRSKKSKPKPAALKKDLNRDDSFRKATTSAEKPATRTPGVLPPKLVRPPDESTMTPVELKRARKLARRAARREQTEATTDQ